MAAHCLIAPVVGAARQGVRLVRFAPDCPLEGNGFELPVPRKLGLRRGRLLRSTWAVLTLRRRDPDWNATMRRRDSERRASTAASVELGGSTEADFCAESGIAYGDDQWSRSRRRGRRSPTSLYLPGSGVIR